MNGKRSTIAIACSYTDTGGKGVFSYSLDIEEGQLSEVDAVEGRNVSFLTTDTAATTLYVAERESDGVISAYSIDEETGGLSLLNVRTTSGSGPGYLATDAGNRYLFVANCGGNTIDVFSLGDDGRLGSRVDTVEHEPQTVGLSDRKEPHPHSVQTGPRDRFVYVPDMGLDRIFVYELNIDRGVLLPADPPFVSLPDGTGPRHFDFHPTDEVVYVINENDSSVSEFEYDSETGTLDPAGTVSTLPRGFSGRNKCADIHVHPSGQWVYGSNRGHDSIAVFDTGPETGSLSPAGHVSTGGEWPRSFALGPNGRFLFAVNKNTDDIVTFHIDPKTGGLSATDHSVSIPDPVCMVVASRDSSRQ